MQTLSAGCSKTKPKIFTLPQTTSGGAGRPKFNQLEMVTTFTYRTSLVISSYHGNRPTNTQTNPQTGPITIHCATASLARSAMTNSGIQLHGMGLMASMRIPQKQILHYYHGDETKMQKQRCSLMLLLLRFQ